MCSLIIITVKETSEIQGNLSFYPGNSISQVGKYVHVRLVKHHQAPGFSQDHVKVIYLLTSYMEKQEQKMVCTAISTWNMSMGIRVHACYTGTGTLIPQSTDY